MYDCTIEVTNILTVLIKNYRVFVTDLNTIIFCLFNMICLLKHGSDYECPKILFYFAWENIKRAQISLFHRLKKNLIKWSELMNPGTIVLHAEPQNTMAIWNKIILCFRLHRTFVITASKKESSNSNPLRYFFFLPWSQVSSTQ